MRSMRSMRWRSDTESALTSKDKHRRHDEVGDETEEQENNVRGGSPASEHDLKHSVDGRALPLDLNGENREENNLDGRSGSVPVTYALTR
jgi:hypothetical protein